MKFLINTQYVRLEYPRSMVEVAAMACMLAGFAAALIGRFDVGMMATVALMVFHGISRRRVLQALEDRLAITANHCEATVGRLYRAAERAENSGDEGEAKSLRHTADVLRQVVELDDVVLRDLTEHVELSRVY
jgi:uncharacterized membrane protein YccC